jgi:hypothetical protein
MVVETQKFDEPVIDWTKANLLQSTRAKLVILNDPTVEVGETAAGTVISYSPPEDDPERAEYIVGEYRTDLNPMTFTLFNGQAVLSNS